MKKIKTLFFYFFSINFVESNTLKKYSIKINDIFLTKNDVEELKEIYKKYKNQKITDQHIKNLIYIYYYLLIYIKSGQDMDLIVEPLPDNLKDHKFSFILNLLWNEENIKKIYYSIMIKNDDNNIEENSNNKKYWQYTILIGNYKDNPPSLKEMNSNFKDILYNNFIPKKTKNNKYYNLQLTTTDLEVDVRPKLIIDKEKKKFSYTIAKNSIYSNIKYDLILFIFDDSYSCTQGYDILQDNKTIKPDEVMELLHHYNIECKKTITVLNSNSIDGNINQILENAVIGQYVIIPNSQYVLYIIGKQKTPLISTQNEEKIQIQQNIALKKLLFYLENDEHIYWWEKLERILYNEKN